MDQTTTATSWPNGNYPTTTSAPNGNYPSLQDDVEHEDNLPCLDDDGLLCFGPGDADDPRNWSTTRKWLISLVATLLSLNGNFASSVSSGCLPSLSDAFRVSQEAASLTVSLFLLGFCAGPFVFAPLSEFYGRRRVFYGTFLLYLAFDFLCAFPPSFGGLLAGRLLAGTAASATLSNVPGVLSDLWDPSERGDSMAVFSFMSWAGPSLGPIVSGFLQITKGWRWAFFVVLWLGAPTALLMLTIPETYAPTRLICKARRIRKQAKPESPQASVRAPGEANQPSLARMYKIALTRPWALLFDPICLVCNVYTFVVSTLQYMLFSVYPIVFEDMRGWNAGVARLPLLGTVVGAFVGGLIIFLDTSRRKKKTARLGELEPEDRLYMAMIGGVIFPIAMFWFAWTGEYNSVPWIVPSLAGCLLSVGLVLIFVALLNYLVDSYHSVAASAVAGNTCARCIGCAAAPLFTNQMFNALGIGGGGSLIGGVSALLAVCPFVFYRYGRQIRARSRYTGPVDAGKKEEKDLEADRVEWRPEGRPEAEEESEAVQASEEAARGGG
ncbi:hypothetical protein VTK73DRAFT_815 [Phialemonium thermophilum]|uniref:Major facilitator superfamily (MFS) profile domain-containing protein n=1 Tax=Phialemonium thermophilum TaxID=223376 RepID=A0ABR3XDD3_9PEZI